MCPTYILEVCSLLDDLSLTPKNIKLNRMIKFKWTNNSFHVDIYIYRDILKTNFIKWHHSLIWFDASAKSITISMHNIINQLFLKWKDYRIIDTT